MCLVEFAQTIRLIVYECEAVRGVTEIGSEDSGELNAVIDGEGLQLQLVEGGEHIRLRRPGRVEPRQCHEVGF